MNNLRLVNLPEGAEGLDPCSFLQNWIPEVLDLAPLRCPIVMEKELGVGPQKDAKASPRTLIMKFLIYKHKMLVIKAAKAKKDILYKNQQVRFYNLQRANTHIRQTNGDTRIHKIREEAG